MTELSLTVERTINAPQADVFNAWLDPQMLQKFMVPAPGVTIAKAANDPRQGGTFEVIMQVGDNQLPHTGTYQEISPHERLSFTWESVNSVEGSVVTLTFQPVEAGTHLTLTQVRFRDESARSDHNGGWTHILEKLETACSMETGAA